MRLFSPFILCTEVSADHVPTHDTKPGRSADRTLRLLAHLKKGFSVYPLRHLSTFYTPFFAVGEYAAVPSSLSDEPPDESIATTIEGAPSLVPAAIARQNELTPADIQEIEKRLRVTAFLLCVYASVWGMGGHLVGEASRVMCSAFVRQVRQLR